MYLQYCMQLQYQTTLHAVHPQSYLLANSSWLKNWVKLFKWFFKLHEINKGFYLMYIYLVQKKPLKFYSYCLQRDHSSCKFMLHNKGHKNYWNCSSKKECSLGFWISAYLIQFICSSFFSLGHLGSSRQLDIYFLSLLLSRVIACECRCRDKGSLGLEISLSSFK